MTSFKTSVFALIFYLGFGSEIMAQQPELATERRVVELERFIAAHDHHGVLRVLQQIPRSISEEQEPLISFVQARALFGIRNYKESFQMLLRFFEFGGRDTPFYPAALALLLEVVPEAQVSHEKEIRRQHIGVERESISTLEVLRDIRFVLHKEYGDPSNILPKATTLDNPLTDEERRWLGLFLNDSNRNFLDKEAIDSILRHRSGPKQHNYGGDDYLRSRDWVSFRSSSNGDLCYLSSMAKTFPSNSLVVQPSIYFFVFAGKNQFELNMQLLSSNNLRTDRQIILKAGYFSSPLTTEKMNSSGRERVIPSAGASWISMTKAFSSNSYIEISGIDKYTNTAMTIRFSTNGFAESFRRALSLCGYEGYADNWVGPEAFKTTMTQDQILRLQRALRDLGYYRGIIDGRVRSDITASISEWANDRGWSPPAELRLAHVENMEAELNSRSHSMDGEKLIRRIQIALKQLQYYNGPVNGEAGSTTLEAVARWANDRGWNAPDSLRPAHAEHMEAEIATR